MVGYTQVRRHDRKLSRKKGKTSVRTHLRKTKSNISKVLLTPDEEQPADLIDKVFMDETTFPFVDSPNDFGYMREVRFMSPEQYMIWAKESSGNAESRALTDEAYEEQVISKRKIDSIKRSMLKANKSIPIGFIEFNREGIPSGHEGRHRAVAAREVGIKLIPVFFVAKKQMDFKFPKTIRDVLFKRISKLTR